MTHPLLFDHTPVVLYTEDGDLTAWVCREPVEGAVIRAQVRASLLEILQPECDPDRWVTAGWECQPVILYRDSGTDPLECCWKTAPEGCVPSDAIDQCAVWAVRFVNPATVKNTTTEPHPHV